MNAEAEKRVAEAAKLGPEAAAEQQAFNEQMALTMLTNMASMRNQASMRSQTTSKAERVAGQRATAELARTGLEATRRYLRGRRWVRTPGLSGEAVSAA